MAVCQESTASHRCLGAIVLLHGVVGVLLRPGSVDRCLRRTEIPRCMVRLILGSTGDWIPDHTAIPGLLRILLRRSPSLEIGQEGGGRDLK